MYENLWASWVFHTGKDTIGHVEANDTVMPTTTDYHIFGLCILGFNPSIITTMHTIRIGLYCHSRTGLSHFYLSFSNF